MRPLSTNTQVVLCGGWTLSSDFMACKELFWVLDGRCALLFGKAVQLNEEEGVSSFWQRDSISICTASTCTHSKSLYRQVVSKSPKTAPEPFIVEP